MRPPTPDGQNWRFRGSLRQPGRNNRPSTVRPEAVGCILPNRWKPKKEIPVYSNGEATKKGKREFMKKVTAYLPMASVAVGALLSCQGVFAQGAAQSTVVKLLPSHATVAGTSSTLVRTDGRVTMNLITSGLEANGAYTVWWVIFNNPERCATNPCTEADLAPGVRAATGASPLYVTGQLVRGDGKATFGGSLAVGDTNGALFGPGLLEPQKAEVHIVVRTHGQAIPGMVDEQLGSFNGGCPPNTCANVQAAQHLPFIDDTSTRLGAIRAQLTAIKTLLDRIALGHSIVPVP